MTQTARTFDYIAEAQQTKSSSFHGAMVSKQQFVDVIISAIKALQDLDAIKKALFYGRDNVSLRAVKPGSYDCNNLNMSAIHDGAHAGLDILHAIIGKATESGELLEALFDAAIYGKPLDRINIIEEVGDGFWYDAVLMHALDFNFGQAQAINIEKLRARFPNKFTEYDAQNRDLNAERKILENGA